MRFLKFLSLAVLLIAITSCNHANKKMMELIPENSTFVMSINPAKAIDHMGIKVGDDGKVELPGAFKSMLLSGENKKEFDKAMSKLASTEIDPSANIYVYFDLTNLDKASGVMLATTKDASKTKEAIEKELNLKFKNVGDAELLSYQEFNIAIKDDIVAMFGGKNVNADEFVKDVFTKKEKSVLDNDNIKKVLNDDSDLNYYVNVPSYMEFLTGLQPQASLLTGFMTGIYGGGVNVSLADNEISTKSELFADDNSDIMKLLNDIQGDASADFLKYMPANAQLICGASIKGDKLADFAQVKSALQMASNNPTFGNADLVGLVKSINGPIAFGLSCDIKSPLTTLEGTFVITTEKAKEWKNLIDALLKLQGGSSIKISAEATSNVVIIRFGVNSNFALNASNNEDAKNLFADNFSGAWIGLNVDGMNMFITSGANDLKHATGKFYINGKDGKKMAFGDYPNFFMSLKSLMPTPYSNSYEAEPDSDFDYEDYDSVAVDATGY